MSYLMSHNICDGIPMFELSGTKSAVTAQEIWAAVLLQVEERKLDRLLIVDEMTDELTVWDIVDIEAFLTVSSFPRDVHVAIIDQALMSKERNSNAFGELYLQNRGWHRIKMFASREQALAWLRDNPGSQATDKQGDS